MKIKRFVAKDIRLTMRMVKEELGADAVIMSNRSVDEGVEIIAAKDFDEKVFHKQLNTPLKPTASNKKIELADFEAEKNKIHLIRSPRKKDAEASMPKQSMHRPIDQYVGYAEKIHLASKKNKLAPKNETTGLSAENTIEKQNAIKNQANINRQITLNDAFMQEMRKEIKSIKSALDTRLSEISLNQGMPGNPIRIDLLHRLAEMGFSKKLNLKIANSLDIHEDADTVFNKAKEILTKVLPIANDNLLEHGGIVALVGPTGVGKTTTIAKLAAEYVLKHGAQQVAMITTDNYRIGAHEQLLTYGRLLDVPVRVANNAEELQMHISSFKDKSLILIDTAGMSQRDMRLTEQIKTLKQNNLPIKTYLVISAATQYKAITEIIHAFKIFQPEFSILTKLDETVVKGSSLSAIIENQIPLSFVTQGQQVPEDISIPDAYTMIEQCVTELNEESNYNAELSQDEWPAEGYA